TLVGAGTCSLTASQAGNTAYAAATPGTQTFTVGLTPQAITFVAPASIALGSAPFSVGATASSGLAVAYASNSLTICTVSGATVTLVGAGTCSLTASQAGNGTYAAAAPVTQTFTVGLTPQTITFVAPGSIALGSAPFSVGATARSGLAVAYAGD